MLFRCACSVKHPAQFPTFPKHAVSQNRDSLRIFLKNDPDFLPENSEKELFKEITMNTSEIVRMIQPGSTLIIQASFKPCKQEGLTPEDLIAMLTARLGDEGTLLMPTFTYSYSGKKCEPYDPQTTPGCYNGILSETFRKTKGVLRSGNPTYSVAAWGKHAKYLTMDSEDDAGLGPGSSYANALKLDVKLLLLNVGNNRNSMLHYAEIVSGVPYNDIPFRESWGRTALTLHGEIALKNGFPACSEAFSKFDEVFVRQGFSRKFGESFLIDARKMVDYIVREIRRKPDIMLCDNFDCEPCTLRRARLHAMLR